MRSRAVGSFTYKGYRTSVVRHTSPVVLPRSAARGSDLKRAVDARSRRRYREAAEIEYRQVNIATLSGQP